MEELRGIELPDGAGARVRVGKGLDTSLGMDVFKLGCGVQYPLQRDPFSGIHFSGQRTFGVGSRSRRFRWWKAFVGKGVEYGMMGIGRRTIFLMRG